MDSVFETLIPLLNDTTGEREWLGEAGNLRSNSCEELEGIKDSVVDTAEAYLQGEIQDELHIDIADAENEEILDRLSDGMEAAGDCVLENYNIISTPAADEDNAGGSVCSITEHDQFVHDNIDYEIECYNDDTPGAELWYVKNTNDDNRGQATTGVVFEDEDYGVSLLISGIAVVGDQHFFHCETSGIGLYQYFFVNEFDYAMPSCMSGLHTIDENWARFAGHCF
jgi:hypothetical protein